MQLKQDTRTETERLRDELASLRVSYDEKMKAYKDLFDLKIKLDQELERYRQLLDAEEERLVLVLFWLGSQNNTGTQQSTLWCCVGEGGVQSCSPSLPLFVPFV